MIVPSYYVARASPLPPDVGYLFGGSQHSSIDACSAASFNFGVLAEYEHMSLPAINHDLFY